MKQKSITFATLTARLERAIHADVGLKGLNILIYGWITKYGRCSRLLLADRKRKEGEFYLTLSEAQHFSLYAGYDLTKD